MGERDFETKFDTFVRSIIAGRFYIFDFPEILQAIIYEPPPKSQNRHFDGKIPSGECFWYIFVKDYFNFLRVRMKLEMRESSWFLLHLV